MPITRCTHSTVVRLYEETAICYECRKPGHFGWLYQCTEDVEDLIEYKTRNEQPMLFDSLGTQLYNPIPDRKGSASARESNLSFFREVTKSELSQYSPGQIEFILRHRENVARTIHRQLFEKNGLDILGRVNGFLKNTQPTKPWVRTPDSICTYAVCPHCRPYQVERSYLSLNAALKGETLPTAAVGFGFHLKSQRPVVDANVVRNIGSRTSVKSSECSLDDDDDDKSAGANVVGFLQEHIAREQERWNASVPASDDSNHPMKNVSNFSKYHTHGTLRHSPRCDNLAMYSVLPLLEPFSTSQPHCSSTTPTCRPGPVHITLPRETMIASCNPQTLEQAVDPSLPPFSSNISSKGEPVPNYPQIQTEESQVFLNETLEVVDGTARSRSPSVPKDCCSDPGSPLCERTGSHESLSAAEGAGGSHFGSEPLKVDHGLALMEESVELGVPDLITDM